MRKNDAPSARMRRACRHARPPVTAADRDLPLRCRLGRARVVHGRGEGVRPALVVLEAVGQTEAAEVAHVDRALDAPVPASRRELRRTSTGASSSTARAGADSGGGVPGAPRRARTAGARAAGARAGVAAHPQLEPAGRRPDPGPVAGASDEPDPVPLGERVRDGRQRHAHRRRARPARARRLRVPVAVRQVQHAERDERRRAAGRDVAQARDELPGGRRRHDRDDELGNAEDLAALGQRRRVEDEAAAVLRALVGGPVGAARPRRARSGRPSHARACRRALARAPAPARRRAAPAAEREPARRPVERRPGRLADPAAGAHLGLGARLDALRHERAQRRLVVAWSAAQVLVEDSDAALQEADRRPWRADVGVDVRPRAEQAAHAVGRRLEHAEDRAAVGVGEAPDHLDVAGDRAGIVADRAVLPERVAALVRRSTRARTAALRRAARASASRQRSPTTAGSGGRAV